MSIDVDIAAEAARRAFVELRRSDVRWGPSYVEAIAERLADNAEDLIESASKETGLTPDRLRGEMARTIAQGRLYARHAAAGRHENMTVGEHRSPPTVRTHIPVGPVAVFAASNFPFAFGALGGDTLGALAVGCTVVVKPHALQPDTATRMLGLAARVASDLGLPPGVVGVIQSDIAAGIELTKHPAIKAVGFTGSRRGGTALMAAAASRTEPIPVYAEMGSVNPVLISTTGAQDPHLAEDLARSVSDSNGQLCTKPGVVIVPEGEPGDRLIEEMASRMSQVPPAPMLSAHMATTLRDALEAAKGTPGVGVVVDATAQDRLMSPVLLECDEETFSSNTHLQEEFFGPVAVVVRAPEHSWERLLELLSGQLTVTFRVEPSADRTLLDGHLALASSAAGRIILNGVPTGLTVDAATQHGGPFPAASPGADTSVGTASLARWVRPVAYQGFDADLLPPSAHLRATPR